MAEREEGEPKEIFVQYTLESDRLGDLIKEAKKALEELGPY